jgi:hypothetical protein
MYWAINFNPICISLFIDFKLSYIYSSRMHEYFSISMTAWYIIYVTPLCQIICRHFTWYFFFTSLVKSPLPVHDSDSVIFPLNCYTGKDKAWQGKHLLPVTMMAQEPFPLLRKRHALAATSSDDVCICSFISCTSAV